MVLLFGKETATTHLTEKDTGKVTMATSQDLRKNETSSLAWKKMSSGVNGGAGRVLIPSGVKKTVESIKEITGHSHSDYEIYAMLKECNMDPSETTQKLLLLARTSAHRATMAEKNSKDLLELEAKTSAVTSTSCLESKLFVCKKNVSFSPAEAPLHKPTMFQVPKSHILGKVQNFLSVLSESNQKLMHEAKDNPENYDIEVLSGKESEFIEMDLMLGVADLHTPEAIAAAESAMAGRAPLIPLPDGEDSSDDDDDDKKEDQISKQDYEDGSRLNDIEIESSSEPLMKEKRKKRPKIVELS